MAGFLGSASRTLDLALYDLDLSPTVLATVVAALEKAHQAGVAVRVLYNVEHRRPIAVPPPPRPGADEVAALGGEARAVPGVPDLMHHKFVVRDGDALLTGSTNWTDDSWSREENVIVEVASDVVA